MPFKPPQRAKTLDGHEDWLRERSWRHRGNADVVRQDPDRRDGHRRQPEDVAARSILHAR
jgi:hypothetical protein